MFTVIDVYNNAFFIVLSDIDVFNNVERVLTVINVLIMIRKC